MWIRGQDFTENSAHCLAGYFFVGLMEFVQVYDSTYICHRFHLTAHLSEYLEREGFPSWGGQKRIGVSLNRGVKIESAKTPCHCVLSNDSLISRISVTTDTPLDPKNENGVVLIITVTIIAGKAIWGNIGYIH